MSWFPFPSSRERLSYDDCPEDKREDYQTCCVLYCVQQWVVHSDHMYTYEQFLKLTVDLGLFFVCLQCFDTVGWVSEEHLACKQLSDEVWPWLSDWTKVLMICIWSSLCHTVISCFIKIQIYFNFLVLAYPGCPGKEAIKWVSVLGLLFVFFCHPMCCSLLFVIWLERTSLKWPILCRVGRKTLTYLISHELVDLLCCSVSSCLIIYTVFRRKHPLLFSFITSSQINQFAQKFQHL